MKRSVTAVLLLTCLVLSGHAEPLRGPLLADLTIDPFGEPSDIVTVSVQEFLAFRLPDDMRFINAIELELTAPAELRSYPASFSMNLYEISEGRITEGGEEEGEILEIDGTQLLFDPLPAGTRFFFRIPLADDAEHVADVSSITLPEVVQPDRFPLLATIMPVSKSIPDAALSMEFGVRLRPILRELGAADLRFVDQDGDAADPALLANAELRLGGQRIDFPEEQLLLEPGLYELSLLDERLMEQDLTFGIERGRIREVRVPVVEAPARVRIDAPSGSTVLIDGELFTSLGEYVELPAGEYNVMFTVSEYTVSRRISVEPRREYLISLSLDVRVQQREAR